MKKAMVKIITMVLVVLSVPACAFAKTTGGQSGSIKYTLDSFSYYYEKGYTHVETRLNWKIPSSIGCSRTDIADMYIPEAQCTGSEYVDVTYYATDKNYGFGTVTKAEKNKYGATRTRTFHSSVSHSLHSSSIKYNLNYYVYLNKSRTKWIRYQARRGSYIARWEAKGKKDLHIFANYGHSVSTLSKPKLSISGSGASVNIGFGTKMQKGSNAYILEKKR